MKGMITILPEPETRRNFLFRSPEGILSAKECTEKEVAASVHTDHARQQGYERHGDK
jgi:hypothetical protein